MLTKAALIAYITITAQQHGIDPDLALAVAEHESRFDIAATSPVGAVGIMQIMPYTVPGMTRAEIRKPVNNIRLGIERLVEYRKICVYKKNLTYLVCYNAGPKNARNIRHPEQHPYVKAVWKILNRIQNENMWKARMKHHEITIDQSAHL